MPDAPQPGKQDGASCGTGVPSRTGQRHRRPGGRRAGDGGGGARSCRPCAVPAVRGRPAGPSPPAGRPAQNPTVTVTAMPGRGRPHPLTARFTFGLAPVPPGPSRPRRGPCLGMRRLRGSCCKRNPFSGGVFSGLGVNQDRGAGARGRRAGTQRRVRPPGRQGRLDRQREDVAMCQGGPVGRAPGGSRRLRRSPSLLLPPTVPLCRRRLRALAPRGGHQGACPRRGRPRGRLRGSARTAAL